MFDGPCGRRTVINSKGTLVHGKNLLQFDDSPPSSVEPGNLLRCIQDIKLDVDAGEYTLDVGLAELDHGVFDRRQRYSPGEIARRSRSRTDTRVNPASLLTTA